MPGRKIAKRTRRKRKERPQTVNLIHIAKQGHIATMKMGPRFRRGLKLGGDRGGAFLEAKRSREGRFAARRGIISRGGG